LECEDATFTVDAYMGAKRMRVRLLSSQNEMIEYALEISKV
jgi:hypothetical protein